MIDDYDNDDYDEYNDESFDCEDCGKLSSVNQLDESKDFCKNCNKGLCMKCLKKHNELDNGEKCAFLAQQCDIQRGKLDPSDCYYF